MASRIQIACNGILVAEAIVETYMSESTWSAYTQLCNKRNKPVGGAIISRLDLSRYWDVPVGSPLWPVK